MESCWSYEQKTLISELIQGLNFAKQLRCHLNNSASTAETREVLIQGILSSYENSLLILKRSGPTGQPQPMSPAAAAVSALSESPLSVNGSPQSENFEKGVRDQIDNRETSKKRKMQTKWTDKVKICSETGLEGPNEDGYSWRKYGQKDILGAKYPRSYYRCTYRNTQNCWATKQVQRSDEDPTVFDITYRGKHTCSLGGGSPTLTSPEEQESNQHQSEDVLTRLRAELSVETENLDRIVTELPCSFSFPPSFEFFQSENHGGNFSSSPFLSPSTPESSYFSICTELISGNNSCTNSPILDLDFSLEAVGIDPNFPFDAPGFFP